MNQRGFSLVELLIIITVIGVLAVMVIIYIPKSRERTYFTRATAEFQTFTNALKLYLVKYNDYPTDTSQSMPASLNEFIAKQDINSEWPEAPYPDSVYDYDRWDDLEGEDTVQISIRFCPVGGPLSACKFPNEPWASSFGINSALYYCIKGNCRSHQSEAATYPGYCVNCPNNKAIGT